MLTNKIINQIFADAKIKNHRLLNKHHSKYTDMDLMVLESIKTGKKLKNEFYVQKTNGEPKRVLRLSDGVIFESAAECAKEIGLTTQQVYNLINNNKFSENKMYIYLEDQDD